MKLNKIIIMNEFKIKSLKTLNSEYEQEDLTVKGGYGTIYAGRNKKTNEPVAIKYVKKNMVEFYHKTETQKIPWELFSLNTLRHISGVIKLLDCYEDDKLYIYVTERSKSSKDLFDLI